MSWIRAYVHDIVSVISEACPDGFALNFCQSCIFTRMN